MQQTEPENPAQPQDMEPPAQTPVNPVQNDGEPPAQDTENPENGEEHTDAPEDGGSAEEGHTEELVIEEVREGILDMARHTRDTGGTGQNGQKEEAGNEAFDDLPVKWKEEGESSDTDTGAQKMKKQIGKLREGNLYQAVIVLKRLEENKPNPMASGAFSRMLNSSKWDTIVDVNATVTGVNGLLNPIGKRDSMFQSLQQGVALVTNLVTIVNSMRGFYLKAKKIKLEKNSKTWEENSFLMLGMVGDFSMALAKAVAIAKTLETWSGVKFPGLQQVSNLMFLATGTSQAAALVNGSRGAHKTRKLIGSMKQSKEEAWKIVRHIIANTEDGITFTEMEEWSDTKREENAQKALEKLKDSEPGEGENEEQRQKEIDLLIRYLGLSKRISKKKNDEAIMIMSLVNTAVGLCSSIITGGRFATTKGAQITKDQDWQKANMRMGQVSKLTGYAANGVTALASSAKIVTRLQRSENAKSDAVKDRMHEKLQFLGQDKYGLKHLEESIEGQMNAIPADEEGRQRQTEGLADIMKDARTAAAAYKDTQGMLMAMGVQIPQLIRAKDKAAYDKILLSDLV